MCFFTNYCGTTEKSGKNNVKPIIFKLHKNEIFTKISQYLKDRNFSLEDVRNDYYEIYATKGNLGFTFSLSGESSKSILSIYLYAPKNKIQKKKILGSLVKEIMHDLEDNLF